MSDGITLKPGQCISINGVLVHPDKPVRLFVEMRDGSTAWFTWSRNKKVAKVRRRRAKV